MKYQLLMYIKENICLGFLGKHLQRGLTGKKLTCFTARPKKGTPELKVRSAVKFA